MACNLTLQGIQEECLSNSGGVRKIWAIEYSKIKTITFNEDKTEITAITLDADAKMLSYAIRKESTSVSSEYTIDEPNGVKFCKNSISIKFPRIDAAKRLEIRALISGEAAILVQDANGLYQFLGYEEPVVAESATANTGTSRTDGSSYELTMYDYASGFAPILSDTIAKGLIA